MNDPLTDLSHAIDRLELCLGSLEREKEDCYTTFAAEIERLKAVLRDLREEEEHICYFYTYRLPLSRHRKFTYWRVKNADEALGLAFSLYRTHEFHIEATDKAQYASAQSKGN